MPVVIGEIVSEVVLASGPDATGPAAPAAGGRDEDAFVEAVVRRAAERVLEQLRREWQP